jgi:hypothetical protein
MENKPRRQTNPEDFEKRACRFMIAVVVIGSGLLNPNLIKAEEHFGNRTTQEFGALIGLTALPENFEAKVWSAGSKRNTESIVVDQPSVIEHYALNEDLQSVDRWMTRNKASAEAPVERKPPLKNLFYWALAIGGILMAFVFRGFCALLSVAVREKY